jgi:hypothetical protein
MQHHRRLLLAVTSGALWLHCDGVPLAPPRYPVAGSGGPSPLDTALPAAELVEPLAAPASLEPFIHCPTQDRAAAAYIGGREHHYLSARDVDYGSDGWEARVAASWSALDETILGWPGRNVDNGAPNPPEVRENVRVVAIDVRNVAGVPHYHYFANGTAFHPIENWSSSKIQAMVSAVHHLRVLSHGAVGLAAHVGDVWLPDLVTLVAWRSDNAVAAWFKTILGPARQTLLLRNWIGKGQRDPTTGAALIPETFAARFGALPSEHGGATPVFVADSGAQLQLVRDGVFSGDNTLAPLTLIEALKRITVGSRDPHTALKRDDYVSTALADRQRFFDPAAPQSLTESDLRLLLYGAAEPEEPGGLLAGGTGDSVVAAVGGRELLDRRTGGRWRIFGKTGSGTSAIRQRSEAVFLASLCLPATAGGVVHGRELLFFVSVQALTDERKREIRNEVISRLIDHLVPELDESGAPGGLSEFGQLTWKPVRLKERQVELRIDLPGLAQVRIFAAEPGNAGTELRVLPVLNREAEERFSFTLPERASRLLRTVRIEAYDDDGRILARRFVTLAFPDSDADRCPRGTKSTGNPARRECQPR